MSKQKVLFLCTHNSARSQLGEALLRHFYGDRFEAYSAGVEPGKLNPYVVMVMEEMGVDMSSHRAKNADEFKNAELDHIVTVCDNAKEICPFFAGGKNYYHESFPDPSTFTGSDEEILARVRQVRDEIKAWIDYNLA